MMKPCDAAWLCVAATWSAATPAPAAAHSHSGFSTSGPVFETQAELDVDVLLAVGNLEARTDTPVLDARMRYSAEAVRDNGQRWGVRGGLALNSGDGRRGFAQTFAYGPVTSGQAVTGLATGFVAAPDLDVGSARVDLGQAEFYYISQYFEWSAGIGGTAARTYDARYATALRLARADGALADPAGGGLAHSRLSLSAPAPRISVKSRRIIGLSAAVSYTPEGSRCGMDQCRPGATAAVLSPDVETIIAAALSFDRRAPSSGVRWGASVGVERGDVSTPVSTFEDPWIVSAALQRERDGVTVGLNALTTNDGLDGESYTAWSGFYALEQGDWLYSAELAWAESSAFDVHGLSIAFGASRLVGDKSLVSLGFLAHENGGQGVMAEFGLRF